MDKDERSRGAYRIDLSASKFEALAEELQRHRPRDRGRRLAELAALGLKAEMDGLIPATTIKALGMGMLAPPSPAPGPTVAIGAEPPKPAEVVARPAKAPREVQRPEATTGQRTTSTAGELPTGGHLEQVAGWATELGFPMT